MAPNKNKAKAKAKGKGKGKARAEATPSPISARTRRASAQRLPGDDDNGEGPSSGAHSQQAPRGTAESRAAPRDDGMQGTGRPAATPSLRQQGRPSAAMFTPASRTGTSRCIIESAVRSDRSGSATSGGSSFRFADVGRDIHGITASLGGQSSGVSVTAPGSGGLRSGQLLSKTGLDGVVDSPPAKRVKRNNDSPSVQRTKAQAQKTAVANANVQMAQANETLRQATIRQGLEGFVTAMAALNNDFEAGRDHYVDFLFPYGETMFRAATGQAERRADAIVVDDFQSRELDVISLLDDEDDDDEEDEDFEVSDEDDSEDEDIGDENE